MSAPYINLAYGDDDDDEDDDDVFIRLEYIHIRIRIHCEVFTLCLYHSCQSHLCYQNQFVYSVDIIF
jgi:hypothetical protein